jgi:hypothetical protein
MTVVRGEVESLLAQHASSDELLNGNVLAHVSGAGDAGPSLIGQRIGHYEIAELIDEGGMGQVYRARDLTLPRDVAVKVIPPALSHDAARRARFRQEAELLASLSHPHIAHVYSFVEEGDRALLVMELVPGQTLAERIARGALPGGGGAADRATDRRRARRRPRAGRGASRPQASQREDHAGRRRQSTRLRPGHARQARHLGWRRRA